MDEHGRLICRSALETFGGDHQITVLFEEMAELQKELCKHLRGRGKRAAIAEELADVEIVLEQMVQLFEMREAVADWKLFKLERLAGEIERTIRARGQTETVQQKKGGEQDGA